MKDIGIAHKTRLLRTVATFLWLWWGCSLTLLSPTLAQIAANSPAFIPPEVQVALVGREAQRDNGEIIRLVVEIPPHHHGYLDTGDEGFFIPLSFTFPSLTEQGVQAVMESHPAGERDEVVRATILRGRGEFVFRLAAPHTVVTTATLPLLFRYQICNDLTRICYPPQEVAIALHSTARPGEMLRSPLASGAGRQEPSTTLTLSERLTRAFERSTDNVVLTCGLILLAGLLAVVTPCVYPMLPITAAIFTARGEGSWRRGQLHALVYCTGITGFYALLGLVAATMGTALSAIMTNAWVHLGFAGLFAYLGMSMLGLYEFHGLASLMTRADTVASRWRGFCGTLCMGATTGLVVSPCIGPLTGAILLDITGQVASATTVSGTAGSGALLRGVLLMTSFGLGLALPFLAISMLSSKLPSTGHWLTSTKYLLALPTLYFAYTYYIKGMEIAAVPLSIAHTLLVGMVALSAALYLGITPAGRYGFLKRTASIILLITGLHGLYTGLWRSGLLLVTVGMPQAQPQQEAAGTAEPVEVHENLRWWRDFALAQQRAHAEQRPLFVDFYATWCANCKAFQHLTLRDPRLNTALQEAVLVKVYDTDAVFRKLQQDPNFPELRGIGGQPLLPLFAIYSAGGSLVWKGQDYQAVHTMVSQLELAKRIAAP